MLGRWDLYISVSDIYKVVYEINGFLDKNKDSLQQGNRCSYSVLILVQIL
jgi:hypothetical protein